MSVVYWTDMSETRSNGTVCSIFLDHLFMDLKKSIYRSIHPFIAMMIMESLSLVGAILGPFYAIKSRSRATLHAAKVLTVLFMHQLPNTGFVINVLPVYQHSVGFFRCGGYSQSA